MAREMTDQQTTPPAGRTSRKDDGKQAPGAGLRGIWLNRTDGAVPLGVEAIGNLADLPSLLEDLRLI